MGTELREGMILGDTYRLVQLIGRGGMGDVWRAMHTRLPRPFAIKVLHGAAAANQSALARFRREAEIASRLGHPNIVQVLDFNALEDGTPYMVMELLDGESLRERAQRGPLPLDEVIRLLRQVASALREAHRQGVVHRDLKPDNIFICEEELEGQRYERVKVLDFGISKIQGSQTIVTRDAEVLGTPIYMAPEQAAGRHTLVDGRTDEFALGAIAYELLSGQIAFSGETLVEVIQKIMNGAPPPLRASVPTLPDHVVQAIDRALAKERDERFPSISEFVEAMAGDPGVMPTDPSALRAKQGGRGVRRAWLIAFGGGAIGIGGLIALRSPDSSVATAPVATNRPNEANGGKNAASGADASLAAARDVGASSHDSLGLLDGAARSDATPGTAPGGKVNGRRSPRALPLQRSIPADVRAAERALGRGDADEALHLARRSLKEARTTRAFAVMVRVYCVRRDLRLAKAMLLQLRGGERSQAIRWCARQGFEIGP